MKHIILTRKVLSVVQRYADNFTKYYADFYADSGLWMEKQIIYSYEQEANKRYDEIIFTIQNHLSNDIISYPNNIAKIKWKSRTLIVTFSEEENIRIIEDLVIR
ncbi:hypothetical protein KGV52_01250 [Candidatus Gracilibacteria bacterium]|nr:hypothetical protein [Candidatus Gracilibacteria bacterium]